MFPGLRGIIKAATDPTSLAATSTTTPHQSTIAIYSDVPAWQGPRPPQPMPPRGGFPAPATGIGGYFSNPPPPPPPPAPDPPYWVNPPNPWQAPSTAPIPVNFQYTPPPAPSGTTPSVTSTISYPAATPSTGNPPTDDDGGGGAGGDQRQEDDYSCGYLE